MKNIVGVEIIGRNNSFESAIKNLFAAISALEIQEEQNQSLAIPLLGSGNQEIDSSTVIPLIIETSLKFLKYSRSLTKIYFIVYSEKKTSEFNRAMNALLGRKKIKTPTGALADILKSDLNLIISRLIISNENCQIFKDLKRVINSEFRPFEFGAISRKTIEFILNDINPKSKGQFELIKKIDSLSSQGIYSWMQSYLHLIRVFGNEAVHSKNSQSRNPEFVDSKDLEIGIYCMIRILDFYQNFKSNNAN